MQLVVSAAGFTARPASRSGRAARGECVGAVAHVKRPGASEFDAVNKALHGGSKAKDLMMTPVFLFATNMSEKALQAAHSVVQGEIAVLQRRAREARTRQAETTNPKPWWKFW